MAIGGQDAGNMASSMVMRYEGLPRLVWQEGSGGRPGRAVYRTGTPAEGEDLEGAAFPVYDDADPGNYWMPYSTRSYADWLRTVRGRPTVGYGTRYDRLSQADRDAYVASCGAPGHDWALARLSSDIEGNYASILKRYPHLAGLNARQGAGLRSFFYNLGPGMSGRNALAAALESGDPRRIGSAMLLYNRAGGVYSRGLDRRRRSEAAAFLSPEKFSAAPPTATPAATASAKPAEYWTVGSGDSLWKRWKGSAGPGRESWSGYESRIRGLNPGVNFSRLRPGDRIRVR